MSLNKINPICYATSIFSFILSKNFQTSASRSCYIATENPTKDKLQKIKSNNTKINQTLLAKTNPGSPGFVWDCKGRNLFHIPKINFNYFFFNRINHPPNQPPSTNNKKLGETDNKDTTKNPSHQIKNRNGQKEIIKLIKEQTATNNRNKQSPPQAGCKGRK